MNKFTFPRHLKNRFSIGVFWNLIGALLAQGSLFLTAVILARLLGKEVFGELGMIQSTLLTMTGIAQVSTGLTATKYIAEFRDTDKARAGRVLGLCSVLTLATGVVATTLLLISSPWVAVHMLAAPHLAVSLATSSAFVLFSVMNGYQIGALTGLESYKSISIYGTLLGAAHLALCVLGTMFWGLHGALGGMTVSALLRWSVYGLVLQREINKQGITIQRKEGLKEWDILHRFMLPAALSGLTALPSIWLGNALLVQQPNGYAEMGIYTAVNNTRVMMLMLPAVLNGVAVSMLANTFGNRNIAGHFGLHGLYYANVKVTGALALMGAAMMAMLSGVIPKWYGMESSDSSERIILILSLAIIAEVLAVSLYQLIQISGRLWTSFFWVALPRDLLMAVLAIVLIPKWGGVGWALAYTLSWGIALAAIMVLVARSKSQLKL